MRSTAARSRARSGADHRAARVAGLRLVVALAAVLAVWNNAANLVPAFGDWYVPVNLAVTAALLAWARRAGLGWGELGLARARLGAGLRWGVLAFAVVAAALAATLAIPAARPLLADGRIAGLSGAGVAYLALVRIPLGTVVLEEVAFRGVLFGAWQRWRGTTAAVIGSSVVFGLWHIVPTIELLDANGLASGPVSRVLALAAAVVVTAVAGGIFCLLRIASGSVVAPALAHVATNSLAAAASWLAT